MFKKLKRISLFFIFLIGTQSVNADTIYLKNQKEIKGLVVEEHSDRVILSTENGEVPYYRRGIDRIEYDSSEQNFMKIGRALEEKKKYGEAASYYAKALEKNPDYAEARAAYAGAESRFWVQSTEGPRNEIEKQQILHDAWSRGKSAQDMIKKASVEQKKVLKEGLGVVLSKKGDWVYVASADKKKEAARAGLLRGDKLVSIDGKSLRYLGSEVVGLSMIEPRYSSFSLEYEREISIIKKNKKDVLKDFGLKIDLEYEGLVIKEVKKDSLAHKAGLKKKDLLVSVYGKSTRYMTLSKVSDLIHEADNDKIWFVVRRAVILNRK